MSRFYPLVKTPPYLTAVPENTRHQRSKEDQFLIIASDGVWGLKDVTNEWAVSTVAEGIQKDVNPAQYLVEEVKKLRPGDDVTVLVVVFATKTAD
jgi:serine/threonine protein phosphatase PrpC